MRQLIMKDFMTQTRMVAFSTCILIVLIISWSLGDWPTSIIFTLGCFLVTLLLVYGGIGHDEQNNSIKMLLTLPVSRSNIVAAKYVSSLLTVGFGALLTFAVIQLLSFALGSLQSPGWTTVIGSILAALVPIALILSVYFIYGYNNLKFIYTGLIFLAIVYCVLYTQTEFVKDWNSWVSDLGSSVLFPVSALISLAILAGSFTLSQRALARKEF